MLRRLRPSDAARVFAMRSDPKVMEHVDRPSAATLEDAAALIELKTIRAYAKNAVQWAITVKGDDTIIELIGFWRFAKEPHYGEPGYMLAREQWGKGFISEADGAVVSFGLNTLALHRVEAITRPANMATMRALDKNGFEREGLLKESTFWNGTYHDSLHFGRLAQ